MKGHKGVCIYVRNMSLELLTHNPCFMVEVFSEPFYEATHNKTPVKRGNKRVCGEVHGLITLSLEYGWSTLELRGQGPLVQRGKGLHFACFL